MVHVPDQSCPTLNGSQNIDFVFKDSITHIGTIARPRSREPELWWFRRLSPSLMASHSTAGIVI